MKRKFFMKKAASLVMASAMAMSSAMLAPLVSFAENASEYTIYIKPNTNTDTSNSARYAAFQIFSGTLTEQSLLESNGIDNGIDDIHPDKMTETEFNEIHNINFDNWADYVASLNEAEPVCSQKLFDYVKEFEDYAAYTKDWNLRHQVSNVNWGTALYNGGDYNQVGALLEALAKTDWDGNSNEISFAENADGNLGAGNGDTDNGTGKTIDYNAPASWDNIDAVQYAFLLIYEEYYEDFENATDITKKKNAVQTSARKAAQLLSGNYNVTIGTDANATQAVHKNWTTEELQVFAKAVYNNMDEGKTTYESEHKTPSNHSDGWTINVPDGGYYLVLDQTDREALANGDNISPYFLEVAQNVTMKLKDNGPTVDKKITGKKDFDGTTDEASDVSGSGDTAAAGIGDRLTYQLTGTLTENFGTFYDTYYYQFVDRLDKGLTIDEDSIKVEFEIPIAGKNAQKGIVYASSGITDVNDNKLNDIYEPGGSNPEGSRLFIGKNFGADVFEAYDYAISGEHVLVVTFSDLAAFLKGALGDDYAIANWADATITVTYDAILNQNAVVGTGGNLNRVDLVYTSDPNTDGDGNRDNYDPEDPKDPDDPDEPGDPDNPPPPSEDPDEPDEPDEPKDPDEPNDPDDPDDPSNPRKRRRRHNRTKEDDANVFTFAVDIFKNDGIPNGADGPTALKNAGFEVTRKNPDSNKTEYAVFAERTYTTYKNKITGGTLMYGGEEVTNLDDAGKAKFEQLYGWTAGTFDEHYEEGETYTEYAVVAWVSEDTIIDSVDGKTLKEVLAMTSNAEKATRTNLLNKWLYGSEDGDKVTNTAGSLGKDLIDKYIVTAGTKLSLEVFTNEDGELTFEGLDEGTYTFIESTTPPGYDTADPFEIKLVADKTDANPAEYTGELVSHLNADGTTPNASGTSLTYLETNTNPDGNATLLNTGYEYGIADVSVIDPPASILPDTGGMGRYLYYAGGVAFLVVSAGALGLSKKKKKTIKFTA